jgi:hypothetical protein
MPNGRRLPQRLPDSCECVELLIAEMAEEMPFRADLCGVAQVLRCVNMNTGSRRAEMPVSAAEICAPESEGIPR